MHHPTSLALSATLALSGIVACGDDAPIGASSPGGAPAGGAPAGGAAEGGAPTGDGGNGGGAQAACVPSDVLAELNAFLPAFSAAAGMIAGHPGSSEAAGFFLAPGLPEPPGVVATFAGLFLTPCAGKATTFEPYCDQGRCSQLECTGLGASWGFHFHLDEPITADGFSLEEVTIDHHWAEGDSGITFDFAMGASGPMSRVWDASGSGALDLRSASLALDFPSLFEAPAALSYIDATAGFAGELVVGESVVATVNEDGQLAPTGNCP